MSLSKEEKEFLDRILDQAYEFIDGVADWGFDHPVPKEYADVMADNDIIDAMMGIRRKLGLTGETAWKHG